MTVYAIAGGIIPISVTIISMYSAGVKSKAGFFTCTWERSAIIAGSTISSATPFFDFDGVSYNGARAELEGLGSYHKTLSGFMGSKSKLRSPDFVYKSSVSCNCISPNNNFVHVFHVVTYGRVHDQGCWDTKTVKVPDRQ